MLRKALKPQAVRLQQALSAFLQDLREPSAELMKRDRPPLQQRHPLPFWHGLALVFGLATMLLGLRVSGY